ncbi:hypothetical protein AB205_0076510 [Aquarana catesbeiana]|uniref:Uncharacterized protein n=1 Tax=Aquarana catesbeiana TaxID=8400 RepID=A0A2G9SD38_AQUCT|nr:hypothetical protein AB205_0076510 [Aquarana catesbeiana]
MGEQSSAHVLEALKRCHLKNTIALWQLLTALKSQHLLHLKRDASQGSVSLAPDDTDSEEEENDSDAASKYKLSLEEVGGLLKDPFENVDKAYKQELGKEGKHALNVFLEQNGTNLFLLELHEMIVLKLRNPQSVHDFKPSWM